MKRISLLTLMYMLCVPMTSLIVHGSATAETSLYNYSQQVTTQQNTIKSDFETSAECEARLQGGATSTTINKADSLYNMSMSDCRKQCQTVGKEPEMHWYGKAPACGGDKMNKNSKAYKDCEKAGGTPVDWSYCGDSKTCTTGTKIKCHIKSTSTSTVISEPTATSSGKVNVVEYLGKPPFCNANKRVDECKSKPDGRETGRVKCPPSSTGLKCCSTGEYLKCESTKYTGG